MPSRLLNDASSSAQGTIYQLYVALLKCFEMLSGQKVWIERYGDVTISGDQQIETKFYGDPLTDGHVNFWKSLKNWMADEFNQTHYVALILCTTQSFGEQSTIADWNACSVDKRLNLLQAIYEASEAREAQRAKKGALRTGKIPEVLSFQKYVLDPVRRNKLSEVVEKFVIASNSPDLPKLYQRICDQYCKVILRGKQKDFINALLGFVICPESCSSGAWEISFEQFDGKVKELTPLYCHGTKIFPAKYLGVSSSTSAPLAGSYSDRPFVRKIQDIQYDEVIMQAVRDYMSASLTVLAEFKKYAIPPTYYEHYEEEVVSVFKARYKSAARNATDVMKDSKNFYDQTAAEEPPSFASFEKPPRVFRNGVIHMNCDAVDKKLHWRLK